MAQQLMKKDGLMACSICGDGFAKSSLSAHLQSCIRLRVKPKMLPDSKMISKLYAPCSNCHQQILKEYIQNHVQACRPSKRHPVQILSLDHNPVADNQSVAEFKEPPKKSFAYQTQKPVSSRKDPVQLKQQKTPMAKENVNPVSSYQSLDVDQQIIPAVAHGKSIDYGNLQVEGNVYVETRPCPHCKRTFSMDALERHKTVCLKTLGKKRKQFDVVASRVKGTDLESYVVGGSKKKPDPPKPVKKSNWRHAHESFMRIVRNARKSSSSDIGSDPSLSSSSSSSKEKYKFNPNKKQSEVPVLQKSGQKTGPSKKQQNPPPDDNDDNWVENPDYVTCPCCTRRFQPQTAERHIPHCKSMKEKEKIRQIQMAKFEELNKKADSLKRRIAYKPKTPSK